MYRVAHLLANLGCVDFDLDVHHPAWAEYSYRLQ